MSNPPSPSSALYDDEPSTPIAASSAHLSPKVLPTTPSPGLSPNSATSPALGGSPAAVTRTVAIIKNHALQNRLDIEPRILEAGFEIVKERQMEFDTESDPETYYELFGDDARSLADGPVWVYVLERRRAVQVLHTLARSSSFYPPNALMIAPDEDIAELQIASLFASSPPFPTSELPDEGLGSEFDPSSIRSVSSSVLEALREGAQLSSYASTTNTARSRASTSASITTSARGSLTNTNGKPTFRARPLPRTHAAPDITPRQTRAALLRAGVGVGGTGPRMSLGPPPPKTGVGKEAVRTKTNFLDVPGHKRSSTITVASTAPPAIAPRMTKAAALRLGIEAAALPPGKRSVSASATKKAIFDGVPGHKRRETISVASVRAGPTVAPRMNRSAALRTQKEEGGKAPPSSFMFRTPSAPKTPGLSRSNSVSSFTGGSRPASRTATQTRPASQSAARPASQTAVRPPISRTSSRPSVANGHSNPSSNKSAVNGTSNGTGNGNPAPAPAPAKVRRLSSLQAPTIAPRPNKSAMLRASKMVVAGTGAGSR
ncbi:hypothetical protein SERLA73DRAFT_168981 [Serpula lacrymans var. lacrymans S7.3]|uniref:Nucleoside diphosphate kinase n=1 Tax=Serpula lacrymans var. lacrymans (strain S7.3) TaxID=936435 RepID=F8Q0N0_SERL3|nr:hypothetical protein SERLA73DRAFT_168981 [Serpula lacrymans var. lacrymans S7.3]